MMQYPVHPSQGYTGDPFPYDQGPPDHLPSGNNPNWDLYAMTKGRNLGALGNSVDQGMRPARLPTADGPEYKDYPNELDALAVLDDIEGNGIFDAHGTHGNLNVDAGVFSDAMSIPGYLKRERFFQPSEVLDVTTGLPIMYVPGNGFMMDPRTDNTLAELSLYIPGLPETGGDPTPTQSTVVPDEAAWAIGQTDETAEEPAPHEPASKAQMFVVAALAGLAIGAFAGIVTKKRRR
jgi:hypothetical protein